MKLKHEAEVEHEAVNCDTKMPHETERVSSTPPSRDTNATEWTEKPMKFLEPARMPALGSKFTQYMCLIAELSANTQHATSTRDHVTTFASNRGYLTAFA